MHETEFNGADDFISGDIMDDDRAENYLLTLSQNNIDKKLKLYFLENGTDGLDDFI